MDWQAGAVASVGTKGDSYDNAMAEAFNLLFKAELEYDSQLSRLRRRS